MMDYHSHAFRLGWQLAKQWRGLTNCRTKWGGGLGRLPLLNQRTEVMENIVNELGVQFSENYWIFIIPLALMLVDFATGIINAWAKNHLKSFKMREGLSKKAGELAILAVGELFTIGLCIPNYVITFLSLYIILMEIISICENLKKMGVKIPKFIDSALDDAENKIDGK